MPCDLANYSDEDYWSDPDQLSHYTYLKNKYGYKCAKDFAKKIKNYYFDTEAEEEQTLEDVQESWLQEEISFEEISESEEEYGPPIRKKRKISSCSEEDEEGSATD